jgi:hypothetical protein
MTTDEIITLVRHYGTENYRKGKANARKLKTKALHHSQKSNAIFKQIITELSPYRAPKK